MLTEVEAWLVATHTSHPIRLVWRQHVSDRAMLTPWHAASIPLLDDAIAELTALFDRGDKELEVLVYPTLSELVLARGVEREVCRRFAENRWFEHFRRERRIA